jgi:Asp/Glu/hydantoin racemase
MRLLLINPNSSPEITNLVLENAQICASPGTLFEPVTARFGARYIGTRAAAAIAGHAGIDAFAAAYRPYHDGVLLACFGDPGIEALRELSPVPAIGMAEAAMREALTLGTRVGILTGGERWVPMLTEFVGTLGLAAKLAGVRAVAATGAQIAAEPDRAIAELAAAANAAIDQDGADIVVLGGAGLAGLVPRVQPLVRGKVLGSLEASVARLERMVHTHKGAFEPVPAVPSIGLAPELAALISRRAP